MKYEIAFVMNSSQGAGYKVILYCGKSEYRGERLYARHQDAEKAAKRTGATCAKGDR